MDRKWIDQYEEVLKLAAITDEEERDFLIERHFGNEENLTDRKNDLEKEFWFHFKNYLHDNPEVKLDGFFGDCLVMFNALWRGKELAILRFIEVAAPNSRHLGNALTLLDQPEMKSFMTDNAKKAPIRKQIINALTAFADRTFFTGWNDVNRRYAYFWLPQWITIFPEISRNMLIILKRENNDQPSFVWASIYTSLKAIYLGKKNY